MLYHIALLNISIWSIYCLHSCVFEIRRLPRSSLPSNLHWKYRIELFRGIFYRSVLGNVTVFHLVSVAINQPFALACRSNCYKYVSLHVNSIKNRCLSLVFLRVVPLNISDRFPVHCYPKNQSLRHIHIWNIHTVSYTLDSLSYYYQMG